MDERQKKFADYYIQTGNASESYQRAGYKAKGNVAESAGSRLLRNVKVIEYIKERNKQIVSDRIADMEEVKIFWTITMRNHESELKDRLKASEYIAKTNAAFIENVNANLTVNKKLEDFFK
jgi:phage terminase small subunit